MSSVFEDLAVGDLDCHCGAGVAGQVMVHLADSACVGKCVVLALIEELGREELAAFAREGVRVEAFFADLAVVATCLNHAVLDHFSLTKVAHSVEVVLFVTDQTVL